MQNGLVGKGNLRLLIYDEHTMYKKKRINGLWVASISQVMIDLTAELFKEGYGEEVVFDRDRIGITWAQFGHMYANFYVYQYATGISGANALVNKVLSEGNKAANKYLEFLKAGGSLYPLDALKKAGVDLTNPKPVKTAFRVLADTVDRLEKLALSIRANYKTLD